MNHQEFLTLLHTRFAKNTKLHPSIQWATIEATLLKNTKAVDTLIKMEETGGEVDIVEVLSTPSQWAFVDCVDETPKGRRNICYDQAALDARKEFKPATSAQAMALDIGIELLDESQYRTLQTLGQFDLKTSSWIKTPTAIRKLDGALFCDRRYDHVFTYHNGASSYYGVRGFRGIFFVNK